MKTQEHDATLEIISPHCGPLQHHADAVWARNPNFVHYLKGLELSHKSKSKLFLANECSLKTIFLLRNCNEIISKHFFNVQFFWKGQKNLKKISHMFWHYWVRTAVSSKQVRDFFQILRPSHNVLTLTAKLILFNDPMFIAPKWIINKKKVTMYYPSHDFQSQWVYSRYFQNKLVKHQLVKVS